MSEDLVLVEPPDIARTELAPRAALVLPRLIVDAGPVAVARFLEFFAARIANRRTRAAYGRAVGQFLAWCAARGLVLQAVSPLHVAAYIRTHPGSAPTVKQHLAAIRMLGDWLVVSQLIPVNPAAAVRGPKHVVTTGATPVLSPAEARRLLEAIDTGTLAGLDRPASSFASAVSSPIVGSPSRVRRALTEASTPRMRRMPTAPSCWWMCSQMVPMPGPARVARASSVRVARGVRAGRFASWMRCQPRGERRCSRRSTPVVGARSRTRAPFPLHLHALPDPPGRRPVVGRLDLDTAVEVHGPDAVAVVAKRLERERPQRRAFLGKHRRDLPFGRAVDPGVGPAGFPAIEICLGADERLEAEALLSGVFWAWPILASTLPFRSGSRTRHGSAMTPSCASTSR